MQILSIVVRTIKNNTEIKSVCLSALINLAYFMCSNTCSVSI